MATKSKKNKTEVAPKPETLVVAKPVVIHGAGMGQPVEVPEAKLEQLKEQGLVCTKAEFDAAQKEAAEFSEKECKRRRAEFQKAEKEAAEARVKRNRTPMAKLAKGS